MVYRLAGRSVLCAIALLPLAPLACSSSSDDTGQDGQDASTPLEAAVPGDATVDVTVVPEAAPDVGPDRAEDAGDGSISDAGVADAADASDAGSCVLDSQGEPTDLRCTGLYSDWATRTVSSDLVGYDPGLRLWSDGAVKTRWVYLPPGQKIDTSTMDEWTFPVGTKFFKQFVVNGAPVETRLLHKTAAFTWYMTTYRWSADLSMATELTTGATNINDAGYEIPSQDKCVDCHQGRVDSVLGFDAVSLSSPQAAGLPMSTLISQDLITDPPAAAITIPGNAAEVAALGYLHANCGTTCHNANRGLARQTGFFMRLNVGPEMATVKTTDAYTTGWNQATTGYHVVPKRIAACSTATSCIYYRTTHRDGVGGAPTGTQMPPIDTHQVDTAGTAEIAAWINEGCADAGADH